MISILKMRFNIKFLILIILFVNTVFSYNKEAIASSSDILVVALPTAAFAQTFAFNDKSGTLKLIAGVASAQLVTQSLKLVIDKERPNGKDNKSMPSGHSTTAFQVASFVHFRYGLKYATPYYFLASYVVWARVYSKNHYIEDTIVGASIGILTSWLITDKYIPDKLSINTSYQSLDNLGIGVNYKF